MQADAYGMFLVHYPIALWLQYWLFDFDVPATVKAPDRIRADGRVQLGADARVAADSRRGQGDLIVHVAGSCPCRTFNDEPRITGRGVELSGAPRHGLHLAPASTWRSRVGLVGVR